MSQSFENWFSSLGPVTKYSLIFSGSLTALSSFGVVSPYTLLLLPQGIAKLQLWRPITAAFFLGNFSFAWLMSFGMFVTYLKYNEETNFKDKIADYVWMLAMLIAGLSVCGCIFGLMVTSFALTMSLCWVFCKRNPAVRLALFGFEFNANIFPWVLMLFHLIMGEQVMGDICGIGVAHLFIFLKDVIPVTHGHRFMETPKWLQQLVQAPSGPRIRAMQAAAHPRDPRFTEQQPGRHNWGTGRALGST